MHHRVEVASDALFGSSVIADTIEESSDGTLCPVEHKHGRGAGSVACNRAGGGSSVVFGGDAGTHDPAAAIFMPEKGAHLRCG